MFNILLLLVMLIVIIINILLFKDLISPPIILSIIWCVPIMLIALLENGFQSYQFNEYAFIFPIGIIFFDIGFLMITRTVARNDNAIKIKGVVEIKKTIYILIVIELIVFFIFLFQITIYVMNNFKYNFWFTYKWSTQMGYLTELSIMPVFRAVSRVMACVLLIIYLNDKKNKNKKITFLMQLLITIAYSILGQGRTGIFAFIVPLFIIYVIMERKSLFQSLKTMIVLTLLLIIIFLVYAKLKSPYEEQNLEFYLRKIENYTSGGLVAFCDWCENDNKEYTYGGCTFRFFFAVLSKLGVDVEVQDLIEPYVENLNGNVGNVYTIYHWYAKDFGLVYALLVQLFIGIFHGVLYKYVYIKSDIFWIALHSMYYFALIMQFFMDEYSTLFSLWLQYLIMLIVLLKTNVFLEVRGE